VVPWGWRNYVPINLSFREMGSGNNFLNRFSAF
jgi:hypothetical protein